MNLEITNNPPQPSDSKHSPDPIHYIRKKNTLGNSFSSALFYFSILFFIIGFNFSDVMVGNRYQQFMPSINNRPISDITFLDSLTGFAVTPYTANDTAYILKTTNGGNNWDRVFTGPTNSIGGFNRVQFLNLNTGYVCGNFLRKTTNSGMNWFIVNTSGIFPENMYVINEAIIWLIDSEPFTGGVFFTSNGGVNWQPQFSGGNQNPNKIYMFNARIGFMSNNSAQPNIYKTTNGGVNWDVNLSGENFTDMHFVDSLTGWKCMPGFIAGDSCMKKTTNGGATWIKQILPGGGIITAPVVSKIYVMNADTISGVGSMVFYGGGQFRGMIFRTTNSGMNWLFQVPDTTIHIGSYSYIQFVNNKNGWAYSVSQGGIHTTTGGDPVFYFGIQQTSNNIPKEFELKQNYPNPFNPRTVIPYKLKKAAFVRLIAYEITGKETQIMVNQHQTAGEYEVDFIGKFALSSGVYFYRMEVTDDDTKQFYTETKKMLMIK